MSNRGALLLAIIVLGVTALCTTLFPMRHNRCNCVGDCKPNPCEFMWDAKTGQVLWGQQPKKK